MDLLLFDDDPPISVTKRSGNKTFIDHQKNVELHSTFHPRKEPFDSPDFLQPWVQLVVTLIFHTLPPHPEGASPGRCRVAVVVVVSPSVSSSSPSSSSFRSHQNKQTTTNDQPVCVDIPRKRASPCASDWVTDTRAQRARLAFQVSCD